MDNKSAGILGVSVIVAALIIAFVPKASAPASGRFQVSGVPGHAYVIDTATGQVWEKFASTGGGATDHDFSMPKVK